MIPTTETTSADLDLIMAAAATAAPALATMPLRARAAGLLAVADALERSRTELVQRAGRETGLAEGRLSGELTRTIVQLKLFAEVVSAGEYLDVRIDEADPDFVLGARPDLRRMLVAVGPVANFAASNFPFAFSVAGGDTASALAAGCPVIVKAHPGHPGLSALTADLVKQALLSASFPGGSFAIVFGQEAGVELLRDERLRAASFTGSVRAGRALADIAAQRPTPIPFYGELGSVNPVFVTRAAVDANSKGLAESFVASVSGSAGQLCTKPGFLFAPVGAGLEAEMALSSEGRPRERMLYPGLGHAYAGRREDIMTTAGVTVIAEGSVTVDEEGQVWATPTIVTVSAEGLKSHRDRLIDEAFGPLSVVVTYRENDDLAGLSRELFSGNLTGTIHLGPGEDPEIVRELAAELTTSTGRVIFGGWPTGVAVTPAMQHGGPYPATTNDSSTSVGSASICRFLRPVAFQGAPQDLLPEPLRDANPWSVPQTMSRCGESLQWGNRSGSGR